MGKFNDWLKRLGLKKADNLDNKESTESYTSILDNPYYHSEDWRQYTYSNKFGLNDKIKQPDFAVEWLPLIRFLATFNQDLRLAVKNIINLGSQKHNIYFVGANKNQEKQMKLHLESATKNLYPFSTGIQNMVNDLLRQVAMYGCISAEAVISSDLKKVLRVVQIDPYHIRFSDKDNDGNFEVYQKKDMDYHKLSDMTYQYIALERDAENPYAIPPFLSAMYSLGIQKNMLDNFAKISEKIGLFGFISVLANAGSIIKRGQNETPEKYKSRLDAFLKQESERVKKLKNSDVFVGFEGLHKVELQGSSINAENANTLMKTLDTFLMAGIGQDPALMGREKNTSEAFGRVLLATMTTQVVTYQNIVAGFLEHLYTLILLLKGYKIESVKVVFEEPILSDRLKSEQTLQTKINNLRMLYQDGIISQDMYAQEVGYEKASVPEPRVVVNKPSSNIPSNTSAKENVTANKVEELKVSLKHKKQDPYKMPEIYDTESFANSQSGYTRKINSFYKKAINKISDILAKDLENTEEVLSLKDIQAKVYTTLLLNWDKEFNQVVQSTIKKETEKYYKEGRTDKSIIPKTSSNQKQSFDNEIPDVVFDQLDFAAIEFATKVDNFYLGKFIQDESLKERLYLFIQQKYLQDDTPIGQNPEMIAEIKRIFQEVMGLENYKIRRIIDTSVNRLRNFGNINYLHQAQIEKYQIVEVMDNRTCKHCQIMNGKEFNVSKSRSRMETLVKGKPQDIETQFPFATQVASEDLETLSVKDLEDLNISLPAFHPHCRGRVIGVL